MPLDKRRDAQRKRNERADKSGRERPCPDCPLPLKKPRVTTSSSLVPSRKPKTRTKLSKQCAWKLFEQDSKALISLMSLPNDSRRTQRWQSLVKTVRQNCSWKVLQEREVVDCSFDIRPNDTTKARLVLIICEMAWVEVKPSKIIPSGAGNNLGLFACRTFEANDIVGVFVGEVCDDDDFDYNEGTALPTHRFMRLDAKGGLGHPLYYGCHLVNDPSFISSGSHRRKKKTNACFHSNFLLRASHRILKGQEILASYWYSV